MWCSQSSARRPRGRPRRPPPRSPPAASGASAATSCVPAHARPQPLGAPAASPGCAPGVACACAPAPPAAALPKRAVRRRAGRGAARLVALGCGLAQVQRALEAAALCAPLGGQAHHALLAGGLRRAGARVFLQAGSAGAARTRPRPGAGCARARLGRLALGPRAGRAGRALVDLRPARASGAAGWGRGARSGRSRPGAVSGPRARAFCAVITRASVAANSSSIAARRSPAMAGRPGTGSLEACSGPPSRSVQSWAKAGTGRGAKNLT